MATPLLRKLRLAVDGAMVLAWGAACLLRLVALIPAHDWAGLLGVALLGFIAFAFFIDFKRVRHTHGEASPEE
jgi:predicted benzoate:H+ symporter BenE